MPQKTIPSRLFPTATAIHDFLNSTHSGFACGQGLSLRYVCTILYLAVSQDGPVRSGDARFFESVQHGTQGSVSYGVDLHSKPLVPRLNHLC